MVEGETKTKPLPTTLPIPLSILIWSAAATAQPRAADFPTVIALTSESKASIFGEMEVMPS